MQKKEKYLKYKNKKVKEKNKGGTFQHISETLQHIPKTLQKQFTLQRIFSIKMLKKNFTTHFVNICTFVFKSEN